MWCSTVFGIMARYFGVTRDFHCFDRMHTYIMFYARDKSNILYKCCKIFNSVKSKGVGGWCMQSWRFSLTKFYVNLLHSMSLRLTFWKETEATKPAWSGNKLNITFVFYNQLFFFFLWSYLNFHLTKTPSFGAVLLHLPRVQRKLQGWIWQRCGKGKLTRDTHTGWISCGEAPLSSSTSWDMFLVRSLRRGGALQQYV